MDLPHAQPIRFNRIPSKIGHSRGLIFGFLIISALFAFELFNYSTTEFALNDLLGGLNFAGIRWATILAIAFCGIDFAGIARLFTPQSSSGETREVWYLFGAWLLAASMNAMLTWWGVSLAIVNHQSSGGSVISSENLLLIVPIFVAVLVWLIRVLIIGTFSVAGDRLFSQASHQYHQSSPSHGDPVKSSANTSITQSTGFHPLPKSTSQPPVQARKRPEPTYQSAQLNRNSNSNPTKRQ
jgi:hypothetical protein